VEEALVEKEVYEAMLKMRANINDALGTAPNSVAGSSSSSPRAPRRGRNSPEWEYVYGDGAIPEPKRTVDSPVSTDVMAPGDVARDKNRPIAPYIPPTVPVRGSGNPFPKLDGPMG